MVVDAFTLREARANRFIRTESIQITAVQRVEFTATVVPLCGLVIGDALAASVEIRTQDATGDGVRPSEHLIQERGAPGSMQAQRTPTVAID
jgi:hypothetical protein